MPDNHDIVAIVVGYTDYGESDRIARLVSADLGQISVMGRAARASKKRLAGVLDLGNKITASVRPSQGEIWKLKSAELEHGYLPIRSDIHKLALMSYCCELASRFAQPGLPAPKVYGLLEHTLGLLEKCDKGFGARFRNGFELKLLSFSGLQPTLSTCVCCGKASNASMVYSVPLGGAAHRACAPEVDTMAPIKWLMELDQSLHLPLTKSIGAPIQNGPNWIISKQIEHHIEAPLRSRSFLASIEA